MIIMNVKKYNISMDLQMPSGSYDGQVIIDLDMLKKNEPIILNSVDLDIKSIKINGASTTFRFNLPQEELLIDNPLVDGPAKLEILYSGAPTKSLVGLYRASQNPPMLSTQFEAIGARKMFPCIDNPGYKAVFEISVTVNKPYEAISNMPVKNTEDLGQKRRFNFKETPLMSTYLVYLGIGEFEKLEEKYNNISVGTIVVKGREVNKTKLALEYEKKFLKSHEDYFGIPYPLEKEVLIAVPEFAMGAMENWGAITFREILLFNDESSSIQSRRRSAEVIAHELVHQWFGNLVTMKWWNDLWLNESFATYIAFKAVDKLYPEWNIMADFIKSEMVEPMETDALNNTHPIYVNVKNPNEIDQIFDEISYGKGGNILRMIDYYIGEEVFQKGIMNYLKKYSYSNTEGYQFWAEMDAVSGIAVSKIVNDWLNRDGYPLVEVSLEGNTLKFIQKRFMLNGKHKEGIWSIPLVINIDGNVKKVLMEKRYMELPLDKTPSFVKVNHLQTGFYRVKYSQDLFNNLIKSVNQLSSYDKFGLVHDYYALLMSKDVKLRDYLSLVTAIQNETDPLCVTEISNELDELLLILENNKNLAKVTKNFLHYHVSRLGTVKKEGEKEDDSILRGLLMARLVLLDNQFAKFIAPKFHDYDKIDPELRLSVALAKARSSDIRGFSEIVEKYRSVKGDEDRIKLMSSLVYINDPAASSLAFAFMNSGEVKKQDLFSIIANAVKNPKTRNVAWEWAKLYLLDVLDLFKGASTPSRMLQRFIPLFGLYKKNEVLAFIHTNEGRLSYATMGIKKGLELMDIYISLSKSL